MRALAWLVAAIAVPTLVLWASGVPLVLIGVGWFYFWLWVFHS